MQMPSDYIRSALIDKVARNAAYSLRALARDLGVSHTYLSLILNNKKRISAHQAAWFAETLGFSSDHKEKFIRSTLQEPKRKSKKRSSRSFQQIDVDQLKCLSSWYDWAILELTLLKNFRPDPLWISQKLGITPGKVQEAVERLQRLNLLAIEKNNWIKKESLLAIPTKRSHACMRQLQRQFIQKALRDLNNNRPSHFEKRTISAAMIPCNPSRVAEAKKRVEKFRRSLIRFLGEGDCTELYQLNVQLFPLSKEVQ